MKRNKGLTTDEILAWLLIIYFAISILIMLFQFYVVFQRWIHGDYNATLPIQINVGIPVTG